MNINIGYKLSRHCLHWRIRALGFHSSTKRSTFKKKRFQNL